MGFIAKAGKGVHALCHASINIPSTAPIANTSDRIGRIFNSMANWIFCPVPKLTYRGTNVDFETVHHLAYNNPFGSTLQLVVENVARVGCLILFPRLTAVLVTAVVISRTVSCLLSPTVKRTFLAIVENRLDDRKTRDNQIQLYLICQRLQILSGLVNLKSTQDKKIPEQIKNFGEYIKEANIGIRYGQLLKTANGETVETLGTRILQQLNDFMATTDQERNKTFDTSDIVKLTNLLE